MQIGTVKIDGRLVLAPMAGVTDLAFRRICREHGAALTVTEMVSTKALCYQDRKSVPLLKLGEGEHPAAAQIFGSDPKCMEEAAAIAGEVSGADIIDINMGCPVGKVVNSAAAQITGTGLLTLSEETRPIRGGFIMVDGPVEVNCAFEAMVRAQREQLEKPVAEILFQK